MINITAGDVALKKDVSLPSDASLKDAITLMERNGEGVVVLIDEEKPVGIITERDVIGLFINQINLSKPAIEFATRHVITIESEESVLSCLGKMASGNIRRLIVLDKGRFVGVITQRRILNLEEVISMLDLKVSHLVEDKTLVSVSADVTLKEALDLMRDSGVGALPVVSRGKLKGIITERDVLKLTRKGVDPESKVEDYMTYPVVTASPEESISSVYRKMKSRNIRRIVIVDEQGKPINIVTYRDIARNIAIDYIQGLERKIMAMKSLVDNIPEVVLEIKDMEGIQLISWANRHAKETLGDIIGKEPRLILNDRDWDRIYMKLRVEKKVSEKVIADEDVWNVSGFYVEVGRRGFIHLFLKNITEEFNREFVDPLTGVYNDKLLRESLRKELEWSRRYKRGLSLLFVRFEDVLSEEVLKLTAQILTKNLRRYDLVARISSNTFYVLLPDTPRDTASCVSERILRKLEGKGLLRGLSNIGIYSYPENDEELRDLLAGITERG